jgi:hypothetical protein
VQGACGAELGHGRRGESEGADSVATAAA